MDTAEQGESSLISLIKISKVETSPMSLERAREIYDSSPSLKAAALLIGIYPGKLRYIRDSQGWQKKRPVEALDSGRGPGKSLYDSVESSY